LHVLVANKALYGELSPGLVAYYIRPTSKSLLSGKGSVHHKGPRYFPWHNFVGISALGPCGTLLVLGFGWWGEGIGQRNSCKRGGTAGAAGTKRTKTAAPMGAALFEHIFVPSPTSCLRLTFLNFQKGNGLGSWHGALPVLFVERNGDECDISGLHRSLHANEWGRNHYANVASMLMNIAIPQD